jgi:hypothetical protein
MTDVYKWKFPLDPLSFAKASRDNEMIAWCSEVFGTTPSGPSWLLGYTEIFFSNEADYTLFSLRWS